MLAAVEMQTSEDKKMLNFDEKGLIPAIAQDANTGEVLMLAYMNEESLRRTLASGQAWFYSRSRQELWHKGETSGSFLNIRSIFIDCDADTLLLKAEPTGPVCHTGNRTCFFQELSELEVKEEAPPSTQTSAGPEILGELFGVIQERQRNKPEGSYVSSLLEEGIDKVAKKIVEEAGETVIAAKNQSFSEGQQVVGEVADLWFHTLVLLAACGLSPQDVWEELRRRRR
jgi:phosphoribosyl-ATP pyrophosphohydrolase/phosphoribosyl-AMP cyclohydrolase